MMAAAAPREKAMDCAVCGSASKCSAGLSITTLVPAQDLRLLFHSKKSCKKTSSLPLNPVAKENRKTIRVVLAEDQGMVLGALAALLEIEGDITVVAQARNGKEAVDAVLPHKPD